MSSPTSNPIARILQWPADHGGLIAHTVTLRDNRYRRGSRIDVPTSAILFISKDLAKDMREIEAAMIAFGCDDGADVAAPQVAWRRIIKLLRLK